MTTADGSANRWLADGERYRTRPLLSPRYPMTVKSGRVNSTAIIVNGDFAAARAAGYRAEREILEGTAEETLNIPLFASCDDSAGGMESSGFQREEKNRDPANLLREALTF